jgi:uncharacterized protein YbbC (DUF1343 family)
MLETGLDVLAQTPPGWLVGKRLGILANQASVDRSFRPAHHVIDQVFPGQVRALFSPQHGWFGVEQANMIESPHAWDDRLQLPIFSLYSETRTPTKDMLGNIDVLLVDLQDVGTRIYTFIWTVVHCMIACRAEGIPLVILDRPNPIGGRAVEGPLLSPDYFSFVGLASVPMRHGLTMAELVHACNLMLAIDAEVHVIPMRGWQRSQMFPTTERPWLAPSPNLSRWEGVLTYPGMVLLEGTNLSEGRGTTLPFEVFGAPYLAGKPWLQELDRFQLPGVVFREFHFRPTFDKWEGERCVGAMIHVVDETRFRPYQTAVAILSVVKKLAPAEFSWRSPPYEYETQKMPIDILSGSPMLRRAIDSGMIQPGFSDSLVGVLDADRWWKNVGKSLLYS